MDLTAWFKKKKQQKKNKSAAVCNVVKLLWGFYLQGEKTLSHV